MNITLCQIVFYKPVKIYFVSFLHSVLRWQYQQHLHNQHLVSRGAGGWEHPVSSGGVSATLCKLVRKSPAVQLPGGWWFISVALEKMSVEADRDASAQRGGRLAGGLPTSFLETASSKMSSGRRTPSYSCPSPWPQDPLIRCRKSNLQVYAKGGESLSVPTLILMPYLDWYNDSRDLVSQCCRINVITVTEILFS